MRKSAQRIVQKLRDNGHEAFFAGGWVRDLLLGRPPKDIDIATSALPDQVVGLFEHSNAIGAEFGVVQVRFYGHSFEVTTFRSERDYLDGRHPSKVQFSDPHQDALRRDFTINGLFFDPIENNLIDYVGGRTDLEKKILRTIGDPLERFGEDRLRMLRAVRLACNLELEIEDGTWRGLCALAGEVLCVSWERIRDEILGILTGSNPARGLELLHQSGLLARILPEVEAMIGVQQPPEFHPEGDVYIHTRMMLSMLSHPSPALALGVLLHDVGKPPTYVVRERIRFDGHVDIGAKLSRQICARLRLPRATTEEVVDLVACHLKFIEVKRMRESTLRRFLTKSNFDDHLELHRVDCLSSHGDLESYDFCKKKLQAYSAEPTPGPPLLTGHDLIHLGYEPGPVFSQILRAVEDLHMERRLRSRKDAVQFTKETFPLPEESR